MLISVFLRQILKIFKLWTQKIFNLETLKLSKFCQHPNAFVARCCNFSTFDRFLVMHSSVLNMPVLHKLQTYPRNKFKAYYFKNTYLSIYCEMLSVRVLRTDQSNQIAIDLIMWSDTIENQLWITKRNLTISLFGPLPTLFMIICPQKDGQLLSNFPLYLRKDLIKMKVQQMVSQNY